MEKKTHTLEYIKRQASKLKKERNIKHADALEIVAKNLGYSNWQHCQRSLSKPSIPQITLTKEIFHVSFTDWLKRHKNRDSPLGDLATDMLRDSTWPLYNTVEEYQYYLRSKNAHSDAVRTLKESWKTYTTYLKRKNLPQIKRIQLKKEMPRKIVYAKNIKPLHYSERKHEVFNVGDKAWVSWGGQKAIPVIVTEVDDLNYSVKAERPLSKAGDVYSLFLDEVRSTPELACINHVTF